MCIRWFICSCKRAETQANRTHSTVSVEGQTVIHCVAKCACSGSYLLKGCFHGKCGMWAEISLKYSISLQCGNYTRKIYICIGPDAWYLRASATVAPWTSSPVTIFFQTWFVIHAPTNSLNVARVPLAVFIMIDSSCIVVFAWSNRFPFFFDRSLFGRRALTRLPSRHTC